MVEATAAKEVRTDAPRLVLDVETDRDQRRLVVMIERDPTARAA